MITVTSANEQTSRFAFVAADLNEAQCAAMRAWLQERLDEFDLPDVSHANALLVARSLVEYASRTASGPSELLVRHTSRHLHLAVETPTTTRSDDESMAERDPSLILIKRYSARWGAERERTGTVLWADMPTSHG